MRKFVQKSFNDLSLKLHQYRNSRANVSLIIGPLGSGKTWVSLEKIFTLMCEQEPNSSGVRRTKFLAIRNTYSELKTTTIADWRELYDNGSKGGKNLFGKYRAGGSEPPSHKLDFRLPDGTIVDSEIIFLALDRPDSIRKLRGIQVTGIYLNEAKELPQAVLEMSGGRVGRFPPAREVLPTWKGILGDSNAPDDDHWLYKLAEEINPPSWDFFIQPGAVLRDLDSNGKWTGKWIPNENAENKQALIPGYYEDQIDGKRDDWIAVNLANEYGSVQDGQAIYKNQWNDELHTRDTLDVVSEVPMIVGLDFGVRNPAAVICQEWRGSLRVYEEICAENIGIKQFAESLLKPILNSKYRGHKVIYVGDPMGSKRADTDEKTVFKELSDLGINCIAANTNEALIRWEAVRYHLERLVNKEPALLLAKSCKLLRKGFNGGYCLKRIQVSGEERFHDQADKNRFSHAHDALQYVAMYMRGHIVKTKNRFNRNAHRGPVI